MSLEIIDVRHLLPTREGAVDDTHAPKEGIVIHYSGPPVNQSGDTMTILAGYATFHMGPYLGENGVAYHYDIGTDAKVRLCRDPDAVLWHCGSGRENVRYYAVHVMIGGQQRATPAQKTALHALVDELRRRDRIARRRVVGHQEVSRTDCPGTLLSDFVYPYRAGKDNQVADYYFFPETGFGVGNAFKAYWERNGGLLIFGYPLTDEMPDMCEDGQVRTVQYFERARFEYHPEQLEHQVMLSRLGAEALARRPAA